MGPAKALQQSIMKVNRVPFVKMNRLFTDYYSVKVMPQMYIAEIYSPTRLSDSPQIVVKNGDESHGIESVTKNHQPNIVTRGGCNWGTLRIPRGDWGTLGNISIRGITTTPQESY